MENGATVSQDSGLLLETIAALESLARAARQVSHYGPAHPVASRALEEVGRDLSQVLERRPRITLSVAQDRLELDGDSLPLSNPAVARFHTDLRQRLVRSLTLEAGLEAWEVASLLEILTRDPEELQEAGGAGAALAAREVRRLRIADQDFGRLVRESEAALREAFPQAGGAITTPVQALMQFCLTAFGEEEPAGSSAGVLPAEARAALLPAAVLGPDSQELGVEEIELPPEDYLATSLAHLIQRSTELAPVGDEQQRLAWQRSLAAYLRKLEPSLRARVFRAPASASAGHPDVLTVIARDFSVEEAVALVTDHPRPITGERSDQLGRVLSRIMSDDERLREIEPRLREKLLSLGVDEQLYRNVVGVLVERIAKELYLARPERAVHQRQLHYVSPGPADPSQVNDLIASTLPPAVLAARRSMLCEILEHPISSTQLAQAADLIVGEATACAERGETGQLARVLLALKTEAEASRRGPGRSAIAQSALERAGSPAIVSQLLKTLPDLPDRDQEELIFLLGRLGEGGRAALLTLIRDQFPSPSGEAGIRAMARLGGEAALELRSLLLASSGSRLASMLKALVSMPGQAAQSHLLVLLEHHSPRARLELVALMSAHPGPNSEEILLRALSDTDPEVQFRAARGLGEIKSERAVVPLCSLLEAGPAFGARLRARAAAAAALGEIASPTSAPALAGLLLRGGILLRLLGSSLRLEAAKALARIGAPIAQQALKAGSEDRSAAVRQACQEGLRAWKERFPGEAGETP